MDALPPVVAEFITRFNGEGLTQADEAMTATVGTFERAGAQGSAAMEELSSAAKTSAAGQVAASREVQAAASETAAVQEQAARRSGVATRLISSFFQADTLRNFRRDTKDAALSGEGLGKSLAVLGGSIAITAAAAPLLNRAFGAIQKPAEMLDSALFGAGERIKATREEIGKFAQTDISAFSLAAVKDIKDLDVALLSLQQHAASSIDVTKVLGHSNDELAQAYAASGGVITQQVEQAAALTDKEVKLGFSISGTGKQILGAVQAYNTAKDASNVYNASVNALAHDLGTNYAGAEAAATAAGFSLEGATRAQIDAFAAEQVAANNTAAAVSNLAATAAAAQASIAALIAEDLNLPPVLQTARANAAGSAAASSIGAAAAQAGGVNALIAQAKTDDAARAAAAARAGGGGGGGYTPVQAAKDTQSDVLANLRARITAEQQIHPSSLAYDKQLVTAAKDTLAVARSAEQHARAVADAAKGEQARHAALQVLHSTQSLVNAAQKDVTRLQDEGKAIALQAAQTAVALKNAQLEAYSNMADAATAAAVKVKEAANTLSADKKGTLQYLQDLASYNTAVADQAKQAADAATAAKQAGVDLANAQLQASVNYADPIAVANMKVAQAQNQLGIDAAGSVQYYQDLAALHQAQVDLANAVTQNTTATAANTAAMTAGAPNQLPSYLALREGANAGAYYTGGTSGGARGASVVNVSLPGAVLIGTNLSGATRDLASALNGYARTNGYTQPFTTAP